MPQVHNPVAGRWRAITDPFPNKDALRFAIRQLEKYTKVWAWLRDSNGWYMVGIPREKSYTARNDSENISDGRYKANGKYSLGKNFTTSKEDISIIRHFLYHWHKKGLLTQNQSEMYGAIGRTDVRVLSRTQKQQLFDIFLDVRRRLKEDGKT